MPYLVESDRTFAYTVSGTIRAKPLLGPTGFMGCVIGSVQSVDASFARMTLLPTLSHTGGLTEDVRWYVEYVLACGVGATSESVSTGTILLGTQDHTTYAWTVEPEIVLPFTFNVTIHADLYADRTIAADTTETGDSFIWLNNPGNGCELSKLQSVDYSMLANDWTVDASLDGDSMTQISGDLLGTAMTYGMTVSAQSALADGTAINGTTVYDYDVTAVDLTYSATDGYFAAPLVDVTSQECYTDVGTGIETTAYVTGGGGKCIIRSVRTETLIPQTYNSAAYDLGTCGIWDSCNGSQITPGLELLYMWSDTIADNRASWQVTGNDIHDGADEADRVDINHLAGGTIDYAGNWSMQSWGYPSPGYAVDDPKPNIQGYNRISRWITDPNPAWIDGLTDDNSTTEHMISGVAMGQPAHPPWYPPNVTGSEDPADDTPPWYDSTVYISNSHLAYGTEAGVFQIQGYVPGVEIPGIDFVVDGVAAAWDCVGCSITVDGYDMTVTTTTLPASITFAVNVDMVTRFARMNWLSDTVGATATITIGPHSWTITSDGTGVLQATEVDLCKPHNATSFSDMQSTISYQQPYRKDWIDGVSVRPDDSAFTWDYPAGWGVERIRTITISFDTAGAVYAFRSFNSRRRTYLEGGNARLYVMPHQACWNDTRTLADFGIHYAGTEEITDPEGDAPHNRTYYEYVKALYVVDGKVQREFPGGCIWTDDLQAQHAPMIYYHVEYAIQADPLSQYTIVEPPNEFLQNNLLWVGLVPQIYLEDWDTHITGCNYRLMTNAVSYPGGMNGAEFWNYSRWVGCGAVYGLAFSGNAPASGATLSISTPNASVGRGRSLTTLTNDIGWYPSAAIGLGIGLSTPYALNTHTGSVETPPVAVVGGTGLVTLRNRMLSRLCVDVVAGGAGGVMVDYSNGGGCMPIVYSTGAGIALRAMDVTGIVRETAVTTTATDSSPSVAVHQLARQDRLFCAYQTAGGSIDVRVSANSGISWGAVVSIATGSYPSIVFAPYGVVLCAYYSGGTIYVKRSLDLGVTWGDAITVTTGAADDRADLTPVPGRQSTFWLVYRESSGGTLVRMVSNDGGLTWA